MEIFSSRYRMVCIDESIDVVSLFGIPFLFLKLWYRTYFGSIGGERKDGL